MKKFSVIIPIFLTIVLALSIIGNANAQTRVGAITLDSGENNLRSAVIDTAGGFAYFGTNTSPSIVVKIGITQIQAVGGYLVPTNKLVITAPYLALFGLIGVFSTILVVRKWRKS